MIWWLTTFIDIPWQMKYSESLQGECHFPAAAVGSERYRPVCTVFQWQHNADLTIHPAKVVMDWEEERKLSQRETWSLNATFFLLQMFHFSSVQSLSCVQLFGTSWTAAQQASLSITNSQSLVKLMSIKSVMPSNHLILCGPLLNLSQHQGLFQRVSSLHQMDKELEF